MKSLTRLLSNLALLTGATVVTLLLLEGAARVVAAVTSQERGITFDEELGWRPLPNVAKIGRVWGVLRPASTNSHGWRDPEHTYENTADVRRAVVIGDSFTFGTGVDDGERFTDVLAGLVDGLEMINLGVPGYGTDQQLRILETQAFRYDPDVVILTACVMNDLDDITYERLFSWPKPYYTLHDGKLQLQKPRATWGILVRSRSYLVEFFWHRLLSEDMAPHVVANPTFEDKTTLFDALIGRFAEETSERGVPLIAVLAYAPDSKDDHADEVSRAMKASLARAGVPTLDTRGVFASTSEKMSNMYSRDGIHWSPRGHRHVAYAIADLLGQADLE